MGEAVGGVVAVGEAATLRPGGGVGGQVTVLNPAGAAVTANQVRRHLVTGEVHHLHTVILRHHQDSPDQDQDLIHTDTLHHRQDYREDILDHLQGYREDLMVIHHHRQDFLDLDLVPTVILRHLQDYQAGNLVPPVTPHHYQGCREHLLAILHHRQDFLDLELVLTVILRHLRVHQAGNLVPPATPPHQQDSREDLQDHMVIHQLRLDSLDQVLDQANIPRLRLDLTVTHQVPQDFLAQGLTINHRRVLEAIHIHQPQQDFQGLHRMARIITSRLMAIHISRATRITRIVDTDLPHIPTELITSLHHTFLTASLRTTPHRNMCTSMNTGTRTVAMEIY